MTEDTIVPAWLFERDDLYPKEKWLYVYLLHIGGTWIGNLMEARRLLQNSDFTSYDIDRVLRAYQHKGLLTFKRERAPHSYLWHIFLCMPGVTEQGEQS